MSKEHLDSIQRFVGFTEEDRANLRELNPIIGPKLEAILDRFYAQIRADPVAFATFDGSEERVARQRRALAEWIRGSFTGVMNEAAYLRRLEAGRTHVRVELPQHYMVTGIEVLRQQLDRVVRSSGVPDADAKMTSVNRLLAIDLCIMLESYKERYTEGVRRNERSAVEEKLTRAEHLAEIGQLAASLAHEIKNPLAGISGAVQVIGESMASNNPHRPIVAEILAQIRRLDAAVKDLLVYSRPMAVRITEFDLHDALEGVLTILRSEPELQHVRFDFVAPEGECRMKADEAQIEQLLLNLIINAAHASDHSGAVQVGVARDAETVTIVVADRGHGMSPEVRRRAFEPFFTTKAKGTGLGLAICRRIIELHQGTIHLESRIGEGTKVTVRFPIELRPGAAREHP